MSTTQSERQAGERLRLESIRGLGVINVETAGKVVGISRAAAYEAVKRGELPTIRMGRRILVPVPALLAMLGEATTA